MPLFHANENKHKISKESPPNCVSPCAYAETCEINPKHEYLIPIAIGINKFKIQMINAQNIGNSSLSSCFEFCALLIRYCFGFGV